MIQKFPETFHTILYGMVGERRISISAYVYEKLRQTHTIRFLNLTIEQLTRFMEFFFQQQRSWWGCLLSFQSNFLFPDREQL